MDRNLRPLDPPEYDCFETYKLTTSAHSMSFPQWTSWAKQICLPSLFTCQELRVGIAFTLSRKPHPIIL